MGNRHGEIFEEESIVNVVIKHLNTFQLLGGGLFSGWTMFKCLKTLLLGVIYSMKRGEN